MAAKKVTKKTPAKAGTAKAPAKKAAAKATPKKKAAAKPAAAKAAPTKKAAPNKAAATKAAPKKSATKTSGVRSRTEKVAAKAPTASAGQRCALAIAEAALDKKALGVEIIDVNGKVDYADYVVVMSGSSDRQVSALARGIAEDVPRKSGDRCLGVEGLPGGQWVLMDFGDVVVHIFHQDVRGYYDIESLWIDAGRVPVPDDRPPARRA